MPPVNFILLETLATIALCLGALGLVTEFEDWPPALVELYASVSPVALLVIGAVLSVLALGFLLLWHRQRVAARDE